MSERIYEENKIHRQIEVQNLSHMHSPALKEEIVRNNNRFH